MLDGVSEFRAANEKMQTHKGQMIEAAGSMKAAIRATAHVGIVRSMRGCGCECGCAWVLMWRGI